MTESPLVSGEQGLAASGLHGGGAGMAPLTEGQESLYILSKLGNGLPVYNMPFAFRLGGPLKMEAFENALRGVARRHHALRSRILETEQGLRQSVVDTEISVVFHDLGKDGVKETALAERANAPFDLTREAPFRVDVFERGAEDRIALFTLHHAFGDLSAIRILFRDLEDAYNGSADAPPPNAIQMDAYAAQRAGVAPLEKTSSFWRERLARVADLELPLDRPRPRMASFRGAAHDTKFSTALTSGMKTLARANKCSPYMAFLAVLQTLIYRYTNQREFTIATPFSLRQEPELENTIGYLINLLPIPCSINPRMTFRDLLAEARKSCLDVFAHQDISLRRILQEAKISTDNPKNALSRVVFQYFAEGPVTLNLNGVSAEPVRLHTGTSKFDLCITMAEADGTIAAEFEYDTDIFNFETIERLARHLANLAESAVRNADAEIGQLNFLTASEKCFIAEINETRTAYPRDATIDQLFDQQVANHPAKVAVSFEGKAITYQEVNRRAERVAQFLINRGVRAGDFVGVCLDRSPTLVAALLGVLKAGAAFVP